MSTLTVQLPDSIAKQLQTCADYEGITVDQLIASAASEKLSALMTVAHLKDRAERGKREDYLAFLAASPDAEPMCGDELN